MVGFYTKNGSLGEWGDPGFIFFLGAQLDILELRDRKRDVLRTKCGLGICKETYSNMSWRRTT